MRHKLQIRQQLPTIALMIGRKLTLQITHQRHWQKLWPWLLSLTLTILVSLPRWADLSQRADPVALGEAYAQSQYVLGDASPLIIGDDHLYQYAALAYLRGEDPTSINFEHPPLAKYLFGFSYALTGRPLLVNFPLLLLGLYFTYRLLRWFHLPPWYATLALIWLALFSSFANHLRFALFDLSLAVATSAFFYSLFVYPPGKRQTFFVGLSLGVLMSLKYFFPTLLVYLAIWFIWGLAQRRGGQFLLALPVMLLTYLANYLVFFYHHPSLNYWLHFEWFRFRWWTGARPGPSLRILEVLFTGSTSAWWTADPAVRLETSDWHRSWPLLFLASSGVVLGRALLTLRHCWQTRPRWPLSLSANQPLAWWLLATFNFALLALFILGAAPYGRYLMPLMPIWLILLGGGFTAWRTADDLTGQLEKRT